ncbi:hypothetical protein FKW77_000925 [Venturia effusa]|uniref:FYVE-type domain-containing protein n=1 Tax=Venturia effusa TaxID=50376 RepID=A0A517LPF7_9PEZI|nr:hypothetical protein FKW77_000925 [Venturia effusa]
MATAFAPQSNMFSAGPSMPTDIRAPQYASQAAITPPSSESPSNQSPVSPRSTFNIPAHLRMHSAQIKPPKGPLYVPAVLRPTEKPTRCSPPKKNGFGSMDSGVNPDGSNASLDAIGPGRINRLETELYNDEELQEVTGPPSRNGWKEDYKVVKCDDPTCKVIFTWLHRKHHCRRCGNIFCWEHSAHQVPLNQHAKFHPKGLKSRACDGCFSDYRSWETLRVSRSNSTNSRDSTTPTTPDVPFFNRFRPGGENSVVGSLAKSVPRDWNWSTF